MLSEKGIRRPLRILLSEGSSLTAREFLSVLGRAGHHIEIVDPNPGCICRFSRWTRRVHHCPAAGLDPIGYLAAVKALMAEGAFDTVEPANAAASGVDLPGLQLRLSREEHPAPVPAGQEGIRTHSSLAILLGTAVYRRTRRAVLMEAVRLAFHCGPYRHSREQLTPVLHDFPSLIPLAMVGGYITFFPSRAERIAAATVKAYSVSPAAVARVIGAASTAEGAKVICAGDESVLSKE